MAWWSSKCSNNWFSENREIFPSQDLRAHSKLPWAFPICFEALSLHRGISSIGYRQWAYGQGSVSWCSFRCLIHLSLRIKPRTLSSQDSYGHLYLGTTAWAVAIWRCRSWFARKGVLCLQCFTVHSNGLTWILLRCASKRFRLLWDAFELHLYQLHVWPSLQLLLTSCAWRLIWAL